MLEEQKEFFMQLQGIQNYVINTILSKQQQFENVENMLIETTYETIYRCMELFDGYGVNKTKYEIKDVRTNKKILSEIVSLHDQCEEFLAHTDI